MLSGQNECFSISGFVVLNIKNLLTKDKMQFTFAHSSLILANLILPLSGLESLFTHNMIMSIRHRFTHVRNRSSFSYRNRSLNQL